MLALDHLLKKNFRCRSFIPVLFFLVVLLKSELVFGKPSLNIVTSIPPFHALITAVIGELSPPPLLILKTGASPHHYTLRPSEVKALQKADLIFWGGPALESFLVKPLQSLNSSVTVIELDTTPGLLLLPQRKSAHFEAHDHGESKGHDHQHADDHVHAHDHQHGEHSHHGAPALENIATQDMHFWLDPNNAKVLVDKIAEVLSKKDPEHQAQYLNNAKRFKKAIQELDQNLQKKLKGIQDRPFVVFHDAYQYFERHYHLNGVGAISFHPELPQSIERIQTIRNLIKTLKAKCVFREPQFKSKLVETLVEDTQASMGELDPLGEESRPGSPNGYLLLLEQLSEGLSGCLASN